MTIAIIDVVTRALRKINVVPEGVTPSAEQGAACLDQLNSMFPAWEESDIFLQWYPQTSTADDFPCPDYCIDGVIGSLAIAMAPAYGVGVSPELASYMDAGMQIIRRKAMNKKLRPVDLSHLPQGRAGRSDIFNG